MTWDIALDALRNFVMLVVWWMVATTGARKAD